MAIHWWDTHTLVTQLAEDRLPESEALGYALITGFFFTLSMYTPNWGGSYTQQLLEFFTVTLITLTGIHACFKANGGASGKEFLKRFTVLSVPVGVKFLIVSIALGQLSYLALAYVSQATSLGDSGANSLHGGYAFAFTAAFYALYYWRVAGHLSRLEKLGRTLADERTGVITNDGDYGPAPSRAESPPRAVRALAMTGNLVLVLIPVFYLFSSAPLDLTYLIISSYLLTLAVVSTAALATKSTRNGMLFWAAILINAVTIILFMLFPASPPKGSIIILVPALMNIAALGFIRASACK